MGHKVSAVKYAPKWFKVIPSTYVRKPHSVSTRFLVEDEQGLRYCKAAVSPTTELHLRTIMPMGVSIYMPIYLLFVKSINLKRYSVYGCYNDKLKHPLFYINNIDDLGTLHKIKKRRI